MRGAASATERDVPRIRKAIGGVYVFDIQPGGAFLLTHGIAPHHPRGKSEMKDPTPEALSNEKKGEASEPHVEKPGLRNLRHAAASGPQM